MLLASKKYFSYRSNSMAIYTPSVKTIIDGSGIPNDVEYGAYASNGVRLLNKVYECDFSNYYTSVLHKSVR